jgi:hypothetical protein
MIDFYPRVGRYLCWAVATLIAVLTLSAAVLSGAEEAALRAHPHGSNAEASRPLVRLTPTAVK